MNIQTGMEISVHEGSVYLGFLDSGIMIIFILML
nr:MAG TPA: hypothetical protein [Caudoviricetes sp.]